ncbi:hypothetical protein K3495_g575 [Podosphaera aphanis]|nr:hypothetical protein K3495_g575 [Podosphaera aphanis]
MAPSQSLRGQMKSNPRIILYFQTQHDSDGTPCSILPLITRSSVSVTHVNVAAIHVNEPPGNIKLNDHDPSHPRFQTMWTELRALQSSGIKVLGMLGGAARGSFARLDLDDAKFELYYKPLKNMISERNLDGLDLDVEEHMSLSGIIRLIDRLKVDFGNDFLITLAPVAAALMSENPQHNLSGFSYEALEVMRGTKIAWYNAQFYCGWGQMDKTDGYELIINRGYPIEKVVVGLVTNPLNGSGWIPMGVLQEVLINLQIRFPGFAGVMGWEYFNPLAEDRDQPWEWAANMTRILSRCPNKSDPSQIQGSFMSKHMIDEGSTCNDDARTPKIFEYHSDCDIEEQS